MAHVLRLAIVDPDDDNRDDLKSLLLGIDTVWLEAECSRYDFFPSIIEQSSPDVGIVAIDSDPDKAISLIEELHSTTDCQIAVISDTSDGGTILRAMRAGAKEFLTRPIQTDEFLKALDRLSSHSSSGLAKGRSCKCIAIAGASGGVGSTSMAVNLGCALAANEANNVVLIDLDLSLGDADVFLDTIPDYTLADVSQNVSRMDFSLLKKSLTKHASGLYLLPRPVQLQDSGLVHPEDLRRVIGLLKASFSHVILDLSKAYSQLDLVGLEEATDVLLITQLDLPCLRNVVRLMMSFDEIDGLKDKTKIVVNRVGLDAGQIGLKKAQETIGRDIFCQIPNDYRVMVEVRNNGIPLLEQAPKASITQAILDLAAAVSGDEIAESISEPTTASSSWFSLFNKGKSKKKGAGEKAKQKEKV